MDSPRTLGHGLGSHIPPRGDLDPSRRLWKRVYGTTPKASDPTLAFGVLGDADLRGATQVGVSGLGWAGGFALVREASFTN